MDVFGHDHVGGDVESIRTSPAERMKKESKRTRFAKDNRSGLIVCALVAEMTISPLRITIRTSGAVCSHGGCVRGRHN